MIYVIHRVDENPGDFWSSPRHYFELPEYKLIDILDIRLLKKIPIGSKCIVGGGGLIKQIFAPSLNILFKKKCRIVFWGIGERMYQNLENKWLAEKQKKFISPHSFHPLLHLTGFRSLEPGIEWVPCASCNHPIFNLSKGREFESIKIFTHKRVLIDNPRGFSFLINEPVSIEAVIEYIASARILITNSYHGMYWAFLLGVPTICVPFSSGHYSFVGNVEYSSMQDIEINIKKLETRLSFDQSSRQKTANERIAIHRMRSNAFYNKAMAFLK